MGSCAVPKVGVLGSVGQLRVGLGMGLWRRVQHTGIPLAPKRVLRDGGARPVRWELQQRQADSCPRSAAGLGVWSSQKKGGIRTW